MPKNHLAKETSPYLQQHADNPVDWYPWNEEALEKAKKSNKPILLSIGYSACHWCHVMAHESFEDKETATLMNRFFINIKVDREERPDLDKIYQTILQITTQKPGGWPLTMFLTPNKHIPFFGGTYFPKRSGFGTASFKEILQSVSDYFESHQKEIENYTTKVQNTLDQLSQIDTDKKHHLNNKPLRSAYIHLNSEYDPINGGFGSASKFPLTNQLDYLLHCWYSDKKYDTEALTMVTHSLEKMALSGLYDHLAGGFYRYCVDEAWIIPHFEKMLYDNAQLLPLYTHVAITTDNALFKERAIATGEWVLCEMQSDQGGYYSTINADSEGKEGKFYVWDRKDIQRILDEDEFRLIEQYFALDQSANFENYWHLHAPKTLDDTASKCNIDLEKANCLYQQAINKLCKERNKRVHPDRDEKILTSWNALTIKGMLITGIYLNRPDFIESAEKALEFIFNNLWKNQRLYASTKDGKTTLMAYLDDYAFLLDAMLQMLQIKWSDHYYQITLELAKSLCHYFFDESQGGFYFTAHDHETLIQRPKPFIDNAIPAGNGVAAYALLRLGYLLGDQFYLDTAERTLQIAWEKIEKFPTSCASLLLSLEEYLTPPIIIILRGTQDKLIQWQHVFYQNYHPHHLCFAIPDDTSDLPEALQKPSDKTGITAYLCQGYQCFKTLYSLDEFKHYL